MFSYQTKVSYSKVDKNGQVPLYEIMNYLQDCTNFQSEALGVGVKYMDSVGKAWVIISYKIQLNKPILLGQDIWVGTTPTEFGHVMASRQFFIKDDKGEYLVKADSIWVLIDLESRKPDRITEKDCEKYKLEKAFDDVKASRKIKLSKDAERLPEFKVKRTYIDNNGHMNNADYLRAAAEFLPPDFECRELQVIYSKEALEGETIIPYLHKEEEGFGITFESKEGKMLTKIKLT